MTSSTTVLNVSSEDSFGSLLGNTGFLTETV